MNGDYNNQQPYQNPQYQPPGMTPPGNGKATGSMVCGILSLVAAWFGWGAIVGLALGIVAIVLSVNAKKDGFVGGKAKAGFVMGLIGSILSGVLFISCVACVACLGAAGSLDALY